MIRCRLRLRALVFAVLVAGALLVLVPASAGATTSSDAVAAVNEMRARMGVAAVRNDETLAADCQLHATWMRVNSLVSHVQTAGSAGFSGFGNDAAARSVLHRAFEFTPQASAATVHWRRGAPLHLYQLLHPGLVRSGYAFDDNYACMWTLNPRLRAITVHDRAIGRGEVYTWPPAGATDVPTSEDTSGEDPNPNTQLGLPRSQVTGPYILVYGGGFGGVSTSCNALEIVSATLTASNGTTARVRWWDDTKTIAQLGLPAGACPVPAGGGYVVAEQPLTAGLSYTLRLQLLAFDAPAGTTPKAHTLAFSAGGSASGDRARPVVRLRSAWARRSGRTYSYRVLATVTDASPTNCSASVQQRRVRCIVRSNRIVIAGRKRGTPRRVAFALVVRDSAGNLRRVRFVRKVVVARSTR